MLARIQEEMVSSIQHLDEKTQSLVLLAYVNYGLYGVEPDKSNELVYSIFRQNIEQLEKDRKEVLAAVNNGRKGGRPKKTYQKPSKNPTITQQKPKQNPTETQLKPSNNPKQNGVLEQVETSETETTQELSVLYNNIINNKLLDKDNITEIINYLINILKNTADDLKIAYDRKDERNFCKHILTAKDYGELAEKNKQNRFEFAANIMRASVYVNYWKGACSWPKSIYQNYAEVYNKVVELKKKQDEWIF